MADGYGAAPSIKTWPYTATIVLVPTVSIVGVIALLVLHPDDMNAALVAQILGFGVTVTMATLAYLKSSETHNIVNSRMDEFKKVLEAASVVEAAKARAEGKQEGRDSANERTDALAANTEAVRTKVGEVAELMQTHDQWERERIEGKKP